MRCSLSGRMDLLLSCVVMEGRSGMGGSQGHKKETSAYPSQPEMCSPHSDPQNRHPHTSANYFQGLKQPGLNGVDAYPSSQVGIFR